MIHLHQVGGGVPDLLVSSTNNMWLVEIKTTKGELTEAQKRFLINWFGKPVVIISSIEEAIAWVGDTQ